MPLTNKTIQQIATQVFFPNARGKHVFVWGDVNTSQRSDITKGTVCYVSIERMTDWTYPRVRNGIFQKNCFAFIAFRFAGVDAFTYSEQASLLAHNTLAKKLLRAEGAEILGISGISTEPFMISDTNIVTSRTVRVKLMYTIEIDPKADRLAEAKLGGDIKVETPTR